MWVKIFLILFCLFNGVNVSLAFTKKMPGEVYFFHNAEVSEDTAIFTQGAIKNTGFSNLTVNLTNIVNSQMNSSLFNVGSSFSFSGFNFSLNTALSNIATYYISHQTKSSQFQLSTQYGDLQYSVEPYRQTLQGWTQFKKLHFSLGAEQSDENEKKILSEIRYQPGHGFYFSCRGKFQNAQDQYSYSIQKKSDNQYVPDVAIGYETFSDLIRVELKKNKKVGRANIRLDNILTYTDKLESYYSVKVRNKLRKGWNTYSKISWSTFLSVHQGIEINLDYL